MVQRRREFITLIGGATAWPVMAKAQQTSKRRTIGYLGTASAAMWSQWTAAFVQRLRELGWTDGGNLTVEYRWADGRSERIDELAKELVRLNVDVIVTSGTGVAAAKQATSVIPIVFAISNDAVGSGFVSSLARPGGNATGLSIESRDLTGKRVELLREISPMVRRLGILGNGGYPAAISEMDDVAAAAGAVGLEAVLMKVWSAEQFGPAFGTLKDRVDACISLEIPSLMPTVLVSLLWRFPRGCQQCVRSGNLPRRAVWCHMERVIRRCFAVLPSWLIKSCGERSQPIFRSSSRPNSI
jgi:putative ABC transport system substrate-binding protein